jgi:alkylated DNA repair dioxygenase AlkB
MSHQSISLTITSQKLLSIDGEVLIYWNLFTQEESDRFFQELFNNIAWQQDYIQFFGKTKPLPRLTAWYGEPNKSYTYSGIQMSSLPWTSTLLLIKQRIEIFTEVKFNSVLINLYRHGKDSVSWHSDDEPELGKNPVIGSVSFGATRSLMFKHKYRPDLEIVKVDLTHNSFLLMKGVTQHFWQHKVPKAKNPVRERINLTFRVIH